MGNRRALTVAAIEPAARVTTADPSRVRESSESRPAFSQANMKLGSAAKRVTSTRWLTVSLACLLTSSVVDVRL